MPISFKKAAMLASWSYSYAPLMPGFGRPQEHVAILLLLVMSLLLGACNAPRRAPPAEDAAVHRYAERAYQPENRYAFDSRDEFWPSSDPEVPLIPVSLTLPRFAGRLPLIVYLPGLGEPAGAGQQWRRAWAEVGYAVLALQLPRFAQMPGRYAKDADYTALARENYATAALNERLRAVGSVLFELKKRVDRQEAPFDRIDMKQLVFAGYDLGAQAVQALIGEKVPGVVVPQLPQTPRAAIVLSPYASSAGGALSRRFAEIGLPVLLATTSEDSDSFGVVGTQAARMAPFNYMPAGDKYLLLLAAAAHRALSGDARGGEAAGEAPSARPDEGGNRGRGGPGGGMPPGGGQGGPESGMGGGGGMGSGRGAPGGGMGGGAAGVPEVGGMNRQALPDNPRHAVAVQRVSVAFLDAVLRRDAIAGEWLARDAQRWLGELAELRRK